MHSLTVVPSKEHSRRQGRSRRGVEIGGESDVKSQAGSGHGSSRRGGGRRISLVEVEEGAGASISPKAASAMVVGGGRNGRATAEAIQIASELEREREGRVGLGWVGLTDPDPSQLV
jgi:hypothetical protein